ncbi:MAG: DedA family protein [bacterium]|nr:DedA family protein [bacterium]
MDTLKFIIDIFLHLDKHLAEVINQYGTLTYAMLFLVIFVETGLVIMPFLPGDSLLFAIGTFCALGALDIWLSIALLLVAAIVGDSVNYSIGRRLGERAYNVRWINKNHLLEAEAFFARHGGKTIILARFVPIVRTFAPFIAGMGKMSYQSFLAYNVIGGVAWVVGLTMAGFLFGNIPVVKANFEFVILGIIGISVLPIAIEWLKAKRKKPSPA